MNEFFSAAYLFLLAFVLAYLEVQIEGPDGWAAKLPTWRVTRPWAMKLNGGRPLTGYHSALTVFLLLVFHYPALWTGWTWSKEAWTLSSFALFTVAWDFLWFVLNPAFGLKRYSAANVWWFRRWLLGLPADYYAGVLISLLLALLIGRSAVSDWLWMFGAVVGLAVLTAGVGEVVRGMRRG